MNSSKSVIFGNDIIDQISPNSMNNPMSANITWICFATVGFVGNSLLFGVIVRNKKLRSNFYLCQMHLALADSLMCLAALVIAVRRTAYYLTNTPETSSPINCFGYNYALYIFQNASPAQAISIAFDRFLCVFAPAKYRTIPTKYLQLINVGLWLTPAIIVTYYTTQSINKSKIISSCSVANIWNPKTNNVVALLGIVLDVIVGVVYVAFMGLLAYRIQDAKNKGKNIKALKKFIQFKFGITSFLILIVYIVGCMGGQIYHLVIDNFPSDFKSVYQIYAVVLILAGCDFAFIISVYRSKEVLGMLKITAVCAKQDVEKTVNQAELFKRQIDIKKIVPAN